MRKGGEKEQRRRSGSVEDSALLQPVCRRGRRRLRGLGGKNLLLRQRGRDRQEMVQEERSGG